MLFVLLSLVIAFLGNIPDVRADVGIVIYESKGVDSRRNNSGHIALVATNLCAAGIDQVRTCSTGEEPGVVATRYLKLAWGYDRSVFVVPTRDHFTATSDLEQVPALSDEATLEEMQIAYWRTHLRPYLPPLTHERYEQLRRQAGLSNVGRTVRGIASLETVLGALEPQHRTSPTEPVALLDPLTKELIPNGHWREAVGASHLRTAMMITAPAAAEQEHRLIDFITAENKKPFQAVADNCSDFVERGLLAVYGDSGLRFRPRIANVADAWITNPLGVATDFISFTKRRQMDISVTEIPMIAGTRRATAPIHSLTRGALVPAPSQGKLIFGLKLAMNAVNPLIGLTAFTVDKLSRFTDLEQLQHERAGGDLSRMAFEINSKGQTVSPSEMEGWRREQVRVFGTTSCWKAKQEMFARITARAREAEQLTAAEAALLLKPGRPFLLPRLYAETVAGREAQAGGAAENARISAAFGTGRDEIRRMARSDDRKLQATAFRTMIAVINYDLSSDPFHRRMSTEFDQDWALFLDVAEKCGLSVPAADPARESLAECSCREFERGAEQQDAFADARRLSRKMARLGREAAFGRNK